MADIRDWERHETPRNTITLDDTCRQAFEILLARINLQGSLRDSLATNLINLCLFLRMAQWSQAEMVASMRQWEV